MLEIHANYQQTTMADSWGIQCSECPDIIWNSKGNVIMYTPNNVWDFCLFITKNFG